MEGLTQLIMKYQPCGEKKSRMTPQKTCKTVNRTGTGHKTQNLASYDDD